MSRAVRVGDERWHFVQRVALACVVVAVALAFGGLLVATTKMVLLVFAAVLGGVMLDGLTAQISGRTRVPRWLALMMVVLAITGSTVGLGWLVGARLMEQVDHLSKTLPQVVRSLATSFSETKLGHWLLESMPSLQELLANTDMLGGVAGGVTAVVGALGGALVVIVLSFFLAAQPDVYIEPALRLFPPQRRPGARRWMATVGHDLRYWLLSRFISMTVVGVLTGLGLWLVGISAAASLGVLAGALSFIPNLGPVLSSLPGILLGLAESPLTALWATLVYVGVQIIEGNFITPFAEQQAVSLPPAFLLTFQLLMGLLAGIVGLLVATPLLVVVVITVRTLYVEPLERRGDDPGAVGPSSRTDTS